MRSTRSRSTSASPQPIPLSELRGKTVFSASRSADSRSFTPVSVSPGITPPPTPPPQPPPPQYHRNVWVRGLEIVLSFFAFCKYKGSLDEDSGGRDRGRSRGTTSVCHNEGERTSQRMNPKTAALKKAYNVSWHTIRFVMAVSLVILLPMSYMEMRDQQQRINSFSNSTSPICNDGALDFLRALGPMIQRATGGHGPDQGQGRNAPISEQFESTMNSSDNSSASPQSPTAESFSRVTTPSPSIINPEATPSVAAAGRNSHRGQEDKDEESQWGKPAFSEY